MSENLMSKYIFGCLGRLSRTENHPHPVHTIAQDEKDHHPRTDQDVADDIVHLLRTAEKNSPTLRQRISDAPVGTEGWTENIARAIVAALEKVVEQGRDKMGPALAEAVGSAEDAACAVFTFSEDHPYLVAGFVTIVVVGVLVLMAPWVVEALGFGELGPVADSFAAWWESTYAGFIPKGSLFSFFQRLGMAWGRA